MANPFHPWNVTPAHPIGQYRVIGMTIDGRGDVVTVGRKKPYVVVPYSGRFVGWDLLAEETGSIVIDVWKDTWANFPPTVADTITGSEKPTLSSQRTNQDLLLSTWDRTITKGDVLAFCVDSVSSIFHVTLELRVLPD